MVTNLVRHRDFADRETDGAVHRKSMGPKLRQAFQNEGGHTFSDTGWLDYISKGSRKTRSQYCRNSDDVLLYTRVIQGQCVRA